MTGLLAGRTALVSGGTAGIGRGIAEVLTFHGARVAVTGVTEERCAQARADGLDVYQLDVRDKKACIRVVNDVAAEFGGLCSLLTLVCIPKFVSPILAMTKLTSSLT